ncbi:hypothetical protein Clacol_006525 [Clathrus columnatus]|uniref:Uncharacterized protein n=1 Tax=Clathrus columnatus TaxID=1419009 RepID=A0AAV5ACB2_9AGAM|nr:hypothetical protein Clacol_006525 [Clathrus columnatus]
MTTNQISWDYVLKFIIIGDAAVGKSSLLIRLTDQRFLANPDPTGGMRKKPTIPICFALCLLLKQGALVVYDVTSRKTFENARGWLADVREYADPNLTCILVGNKVDLCEPEDTSNVVGTTLTHSRRRHREVPREVAEQWAKEENLLFIETSAKSGDNVDKAFQQAAKDVVAKIKDGVFDNRKSYGVKTSEQPKTSISLSSPNNTKLCCS